MRFSGRSRHLAVYFGLALLAALLLDGPVVALVRTTFYWIGGAAGLVAWIGSILWLIVALIATALVAAHHGRTSKDAVRRAKAQLVLTLSVATIFTTLAGAIVAQLLALMIGRAGPEQFVLRGAYAFDPAAFNGALTSFPSGHATTLGILAVLGAWITPDRKWLFALLAGIVGLSRVLTGEDFLSDAVAGLGLGALMAALVLTLLSRRGAIEPRGAACYHDLACSIRSGASRFVRLFRVAPAATPDPLHQRLMLVVLVSLTLAFVLFLSMPWLDIAVARLFWSPSSGFPLADSLGLQAIRDVYMLGFNTLAIGAFAMLILFARLPMRPAVPPQIWGFIVAAFVVGPGLIANTLLKDNWGRARPSNLVEFGGSAQFTLPFEMSDQCVRNCSFISGEGSGIAMLGLVIGILAWPWLRQHKKSWFVALVAVSAFGMALRVMKGRHFLSDTVFAVLLMALVALLLYRAFKIGQHRPALSLRAIRTDMGAALRYLAGGRHQQASLAGDAMHFLRAVQTVGQASLTVLATLAAPRGAALEPFAQRTPRNDP